MYINLRRLAFRAFLVWVFVSAFYYAGVLVDGSVMVDRSESLVHKAFKYSAALLLSVIFLLLDRKKSLLSLYVVIVFLLLAFELSWFFGYDVIFGLDVLVIFLSFVGLASLASSLDAFQVKSLVRTVVVSAAIVASVSYVEYMFFESVLGDYWRNTGGFRSISTLLNPNNLGLFLGYALILLMFGRVFSPAVALTFFLVISGALFMTGSRTAWLSVIFALAIGWVCRGGGRISSSAAVKLFVVLAILILLSLAVYFVQIVPLPDRVTDMYTAFLRLEKYIGYIVGIDATYLLPDVDLYRIELVSESAYFHFFNSLGLLAGFVIVLALIYFTHFRAGRLFMNSQFRCFDVAVFYYAFAMLFENVLMSFPNNQFLFVSVGVAAMNARGSVREIRDRGFSGIRLLREGN